MRDAAQGPARTLVLAYGFFTLAAGARSAVQLASHPGRAPVAYALSAFAALVYAANTVVVARTGPEDEGLLARSLFLLELAGVLVVGVASLAHEAWFPDDSVWSRFGEGYGFVPLVLPLLGLFWLRRGRR